MKLWIQNARLLDRSSGLDRPGSLLVEDGVIRALDPAQAPGAEVLDAKGLILTPGLVDLHVHLRDPGFCYKEDLASGTRAAAKGGVTSLVCMANTKPTLDSPELLRDLLERAETESPVRVLPAAAATLGLKGAELSDHAGLKAAGAAALSDDGVPVQSAAVMRQVLASAKAAGLAVLSHCEDEDLAENRCVNEGPVSETLGVPGRPAIAEELMVQRDIMLAEEQGAKLHVCHVSTGKSVDLVRQAKARGAKVTCETCPQYFTFTEQEVLHHGTLARVNPPLRTPADAEAIVEGLRDGTIDAIATDHAPHSPEEKAKPLTEAPSGMIGLETSLAASLTALLPRGFTVGEILEKLSAAPARILGLPCGRLEVGAPADLILVDPDRIWTVEADGFVSKSRNSLFIGRQLRGCVTVTLVGGKPVYEEKER